MDDAVRCGGGGRGSRRLDAAFWRESLAPYAKPDLGRSVFDVATSVLAYLALTAVMYAAMDVSVLLVVVLAVPAAGFWCGRSSSFTTARTARFCRGGVRTVGWVSLAGCSSIRPFTSGVTSMLCITRRPVISTGVAEGTSRR